MRKVLVDRELLPCPFCGSEAGLSKGGRALCSNEGCIACELFAPLEDWNRRAQPAESEGVRDYLTEFAEGEVEAKTAIEELQDALSAVTAEVGALRKDAERWRLYRQGFNKPDVADANVDAAITTRAKAAMAAKEDPRP